jgi:hypothetical protein
MKSKKENDFLVLKVLENSKLESCVFSEIFKFILFLKFSVRKMPTKPKTVFPFRLPIFEICHLSNKPISSKSEFLNSRPQGQDCEMQPWRSTVDEKFGYSLNSQKMNIVLRMRPRRKQLNIYVLIQWWKFKVFLTLN